MPRTRVRETNRHRPPPQHNRRPSRRSNSCNRGVRRRLRDRSSRSGHLDLPCNPHRCNMPHPSEGLEQRLHHRRRPSLTRHPRSPHQGAEWVFREPEHCMLVRSVGDSWRAATGMECLRLPRSFPMTRTRLLLGRQPSINRPKKRRRYGQSSWSDHGTNTQIGASFVFRH